MGNSRASRGGAHRTPGEEDYSRKRQPVWRDKKEDNLLQIDMENYSRSMCSAWTGEERKRDADCEKRSAFSVVR